MEDKYVFDHAKKELATIGKCSPITPGGIGKALFDKMKMHAEQGLIAQIEAETGIKESYTDFLNRAIKLALYLKEQGIQPGDVVSMCSTNNMNNSVVFVASQFVGAILASTDPQLSLDDTKYLLNLVEPKLVFVSEGCEDLIQNAIASFDNHQCKIITFHEHATYENLNVILKRYTEKNVQEFEPYYVEDSKTTSCIMFSSGTTGMPKGICISHNYQEAHLHPHFNTPGLVLLGYSTLYWVSAVYFTMMQLHFGHVKVNCKQFDAKTVWTTMDQYKVNVTYLSYSHCMDGLKTLNAPLKHLHIFVIVGGQIADTYYQEYDKKLPNTEVKTGYGLSETMSISAKQHDYKIGSTGVPSLTGQTIKIVDPETEQPLDLNEVGEIRVKAEHQMTGYYKQDSSDAWDADGFFKTGDLGYLDDGYSLFVVDRIKEMFKYRGWHVVPAKIENVLMCHPDVLHAVIVGVPTANTDYLAMGVVVLHENGTVTSEELVEFVNNKMDDINQIRAGIKIIKDEEMPYTVTGKINRRKVRELYVPKL